MNNTHLSNEHLSLVVTRRDLLPPTPCSEKAGVRNHLLADHSNTRHVAWYDALANIKWWRFAAGCSTLFELPQVRQLRRRRRRRGFVDRRKRILANVQGKATPTSLATMHSLSGDAMRATAPVTITMLIITLNHSDHACSRLPYCRNCSSVVSKPSSCQNQVKRVGGARKACAESVENLTPNDYRTPRQRRFFQNL